MDHLDGQIDKPFYLGPITYIHPRKSIRRDAGNQIVQQRSTLFRVFVIIGRGLCGVSLIKSGVVRRNSRVIVLHMRKGQLKSSVAITSRRGPVCLGLRWSSN
jgi:hypothetical protein